MTRERPGRAARSWERATIFSVSVHGGDIAAARADGVVVSTDAGQTWLPMGIPTMLTRIHRVVFSPDGTLWLGAREGVYYTPDLGKTWMWIHRCLSVTLTT